MEILLIIVLLLVVASVLLFHKRKRSHRLVQNRVVPKNSLDHSEGLYQQGMSNQARSRSDILQDDRLPSQTLSVAETEDAQLGGNDKDELAGDSLASPKEQLASTSPVLDLCTQCQISDEDQ